ncbi:MAG: hypothetical protein EA408_03180 [Marinilabiliales bacterium]|nr:MAG: hypothetical protein EA408_03180 [Marinilabiliales bacterium]
MKKATILIVIALACATSAVKAEVPDYVLTTDEVTYYDRVRVGITSSLVGIGKEARSRYQAEDIVSFRRDGRTYSRMPVIKNNKPNGRHSFMELKAYRNGLSVYKHVEHQGSGIQPAETYLVYNNKGEYVLTFTRQNYKTLNQFFWGSSRVLAAK